MAELARTAGISSKLAGKLAYGLRKLEVLELVGKRGNAHLYRKAPAPRRKPAAKSE